MRAWRMAKFPSTQLGVLHDLAQAECVIEEVCSRSCSANGNLRHVAALTSAHTQGRRPSFCQYHPSCHQQSKLPRYKVGHGDYST